VVAGSVWVKIVDCFWYCLAQVELFKGSKTVAVIFKLSS